MTTEIVTFRLEPEKKWKLESYACQHGPRWGNSANVSAVVRKIVVRALESINGSEGSNE